MTVKKEIRYDIETKNIVAAYYPETERISIRTRIFDGADAKWSDLKYIVKEIAKIRGEKL